jgi:hypothetical protein
MNSLLGVAAAVLAFVASGCSSGSSAPSSNSPPATKQFQDLFTYDWKIDGGVETYFCGFRTLKSDLLISDFRPLVPLGTHHVIIGYQDPSTPDGFVASADTMDKAPCSGTTFGDELAYGATVGAQELSMPAGVAVKIPAGKQLVFGLHVLNAGSSPLTGHSGVQIVSPDASTVSHVAEIIAAENISLSIPPGVVTQTATCTMGGDVTLFAVSPHMHLTGVHMTATAGPPDAGPDGPVTLLDSDYVFTNQHFTMLRPMVPLKAGDQIHVACHYNNPGPGTLTFGESTTDNEMCIAFTYRYPAIEMNAPVDTSPGFPLPRSSCVR